MYRNYEVLLSLGMNANAVIVVSPLIRCKLHHAFQRQTRNQTIIFVVSYVEVFGLRWDNMH